MHESPVKDQLSLGAIVRRDWNNLPNLVTAIRMVGALGLPPLIMSKNRKKQLAAFGLFATLAATDKLDGWMAKEIYGTTELGKMLDPAVDKELVVVTLFSLLADARRRKDHATTTALTLGIPILIGRELAVARIKLKAQQRDHKVESALQSGRVSMVAQSVGIGLMLVPTTSPAARKVKIALLAAAVGASLYSWRDYSRTYRDDPS